MIYDDLYTWFLFKLVDFPIKGYGIFPKMIQKHSMKIAIPGPGWWYTYPSEEYEFVSIMTFPTYGKSSNSMVPVTTSIINQY